MANFDHSPFSKFKKTTWNLRSQRKSISSSELAKRPDPFFLPKLLEGFEESKYARFADDIRRLCELKRQILNDCRSVAVNVKDRKSKEHIKPVNTIVLGLMVRTSSLDRRSEQTVDSEITVEDESVKLKTAEEVNLGDANDDDDNDDDDYRENGAPLYRDGEEEEEHEELWRQMSFAQESSKETVEISVKKEEIEDCDHSFIYKDDVGEVCCVCGLIKTHIQNIIEVVFNKPKRSRRTYMREQDTKKMETVFTDQFFQRNLVETAKMFINPRHEKEMRPHQLEGFRFLCNNLIGNEPGGCILAHTPGSGKTFLLISFIHSFMAMEPQAKPLIVLPKGIIQSWKKEFTLWKIEEIPLLDFYSVKAESRTQQLQVLQQWIQEKSVLFLGYQQFARIICDDKNSNEDCKKILLEKPTLLILDEGHTSRNKETDVLISLARVKTPRKVVLTGTLFQNKVEEVFNILELVRPKFLKLPGIREIVHRIMSKAEIPNMNLNSFEGSFFSSLEITLQKSQDLVKASVIKDLREMTQKILHYHKADFNGVLPGLTEFTVMLNLSSIQRDKVKDLRKMEMFKQVSLGAVLYIHPKLEALHQSKVENSTLEVDKLLKDIKVEEGVKMKFFLNLLSLCESTKEKVLVFSQYIVPIKSLERFLRLLKGWRLGKEMFIITGESRNEEREASMEKFNNSRDAKVLFGSIKACGEGISLVGASRVVILDVHLNPSVTQQAIGRAYRPGQKRKVYVYRLVAAESPEEESYEMCLRKEMVSKMWFEWNLGFGRGDFEFRAIDVENSGDEFLESLKMKEDIKTLYIR